MNFSRIGGGYSSYTRFSARGNEPQTGITASIRQQIRDEQSSKTVSGGSQTDSVTISNAAREALMAARMNTIGQSTTGQKDVIGQWRPKEKEIDDTANSASKNPAKLNDWMRKMALVSGIR